jgi:hypothetical protein
MDWARILACVTGTVDQELLARNEYLAAENRILKAQLKEGPVQCRERLGGLLRYYHQEAAWSHAQGFIQSPDSAAAIGRSRKALATPLSQVSRLGKLPELQVLPAVLFFDHTGSTTYGSQEKSDLMKTKTRAISTTGAFGNNAQSQARSH